MSKNIKVILQNKKYATPIILILSILSIIAIYRHNKISPQTKPNAIPIETTIVKTKDMPIYLSALGTIVPKYSAIIKTQLNGQLINVAFRDGQEVIKDQVLAQIDPKIYKAQLLQYEGQLLRDQSLLDNANIDLKRYQELWKQNSISKQTLDTQIALVKQYEGTVQLDQGLVDGAKVNLEYCNIKAPFDGKVGIKLVTEGNFVQTSDSNGITVINMLNPIYATFSIPETEISNVIKQFNALNSLDVDLYDQNQQNLLVSGKLKAIDNQIDSSTGTVKLKAEFNNSNNILFPNQFVNVKMLIQKISKAIIIPSSAVQYGPNGTFVYVIKNNKANFNYIRVKNISENIAIIESGLSEGQEVATAGLDRLIDGIEVLTASEKKG